MLFKNLDYFCETFGVIFCSLVKKMFFPEKFLKFIKTTEHNFFAYFRMYFLLVLAKIVQRKKKIVIWKK